MYSRALLFAIALVALALIAAANPVPEALVEKELKQFNGRAAAAKRASRPRPSASPRPSPRPSRQAPSLVIVVSYADDHVARRSQGGRVRSRGRAYRGLGYHREARQEQALPQALQVSSHPLFRHAHT